MKFYIAFFVATSTFAIPTKLLWNERSQKIQPLKAEIKRDVKEFISDGLFAFIFNSSYAEKQEFRNEILNEISELQLGEISYLRKNLEFILDGIDDRNIRLKEAATTNFIQSILLGVMLGVCWVLSRTIFHLKQKEKLKTEKSPEYKNHQNTNSKPKFEKIECAKANVQNKDGVECTMIYFKN